MGRPLPLNSRDSADGTTVGGETVAPTPPPRDAQTTLGPDDLATDELPASRSGDLPERYTDLGKLGTGGMGEVRRVRDRELGRLCAWKVVRPDLRARRQLSARLLDEAQVAAQLQHPNIPPLYDAGVLPDGRPWFTMKEVRGRTFAHELRLAHEGPLTTVVLRRLCDVFDKVCDAVGYAHSRGVVHRDLKPENVMLGEHGEVLVMDWGLAKVLGRGERAIPLGEPDEEAGGGAVVTAHETVARTRVGALLGTVGYMSPEQARGEVDRLDVRSDVYALGAVLYEILTGKPPHDAPDAATMLDRVSSDAPLPWAALRQAGLPEELTELCRRCLSHDPADRPADGSVVADELRVWSAGARQREKGLEIFAAAEGLTARADQLRQQAATSCRQGQALLEGLRPWAPEEDKAPGWAKLDTGDGLVREADRVERERESLLGVALTHAPDLLEARAALAELELARHRTAEDARNTRSADDAARRLAEHVDRLPAAHPTRIRCAAWLRGDGALSLVTDPPGAKVDLFRFEPYHRRLVTAPVRTLGATPLVEVGLPMGSYLCVVRHPERAEVRYPIVIGRGEHWDGVPPGAVSPLAVRLPAPGELGPDDRFVPAGWFWSGGDPDAPGSFPRRRLWCDELVVKTFPVTHREYLSFLDHLVAVGRAEEAWRLRPQERSTTDEAQVYGQDDSGRFVLRPDSDGDSWDPDWPVFLLDWTGAAAFARWAAERDGTGWRLPTELEWEKAARGVDGRFYPWGDFADPAWGRWRESTPGRVRPAIVDSFPVDTSVYGVRGLAGNVQDWCGEPHLGRGPDVSDGRVPIAPADPVVRPDSEWSVRGGFWLGTARYARCAHRFRYTTVQRSESVGFRLVRSSGRG